MTQGDQNELIKIIYDFSQPLDAIQQLIGKIDALDNRLAAMGQQGAQRFSQAFSTGLTGAIEAIALLESHLENALRLQGQLNNQGGGRRASPLEGGFYQTAGGRYMDSSGRFISDEEYFRRTGRGVGGGGDGWPMPSTAPGDDWMERARQASGWVPLDVSNYWARKGADRQRLWEAEQAPRLEPFSYQGGGGGPYTAFYGGLSQSPNLNAPPPWFSGFWNNVPGLVPVGPSTSWAYGRGTPPPAYGGAAIPLYGAGGAGGPVGFPGAGGPPAVVPPPFPNPGGPFPAQPMGPFGIYTQREFAQSFMHGFAEAAKQEFRSGNLGGFESIMQGEWNTWRLGANVAGARVSSFEAQADLNNVGAPAANAGPFARRAYAQLNINAMEAQMRQAGLEGNWQMYDRLGGQLRNARDHYRQLGEEIDGPFRTRFMRHMTWIAQGIAIWGALNLAIATVRSFTEELLRLSDAQARLGFISGQGTVETLNQFRQAAEYGIAPAQAQQGLIAQAQLGLSQRDITRAQQISQVFGADQYTNVLDELYQSQQRADAANLQSVNTLDYLATAYSTVRGNLETYFDALQYGIEYHRQLGMSAEQAGLAIGEMANALEADPGTVKTLLGRVMIQLNDPDVRDKLKGLGIEGPSIPEYLRQISAGVAGGGQTADQIIGSLATGLQGASQRAEFRTMLANLNDFYQALDEGNNQLREFNDLLDEVGNSGPAKIQKLTAAWDNFLLSASNFAPVQAFFDFLLLRIEDATSKMNDMSFVFANAPEAWGESFRRGPGHVGQAGRDAITDTLQGLNPLDMLDQGRREAVLWELTRRFYENLLPEELPEQVRRGLGRGKGGLDAPPFPEGVGTRIGSRRARGAEKLEGPEFGGFDTFPKGLDWDRFVRRVGEFEQQIQREVPEYDLDRRTMAFYDETAGYYRKVTGDQEAIRRALEEQTDLLKTITGIFNVPAGGEILVPFFALQAGFVPDYLNGKSGGSAGGGGGTTKGGGGTTGTLKPYDLMGRYGSRPGLSDRDEDKEMPGVTKRLPGMRYMPDATKAQPVPPTVLNFTARIVVMLNGRAIQNELTRTLRRQMTTTKRSTSGGAGSDMLMV